MDSPKKASVKHLEFQLQREKSANKELEAKCRTLQNAIATLEQEKAELRREKIVMSEEGKKASRYEDRVHLLQKELEAKEAVVLQERTKAAEARAEAEEVRFNANASIHSWKQAEEQWILEQTALNETIEQQRADLSALAEKLENTQKSLESAECSFRKERERAEKSDSGCGKLEAELHIMHEKLKKAQNRILDLEQRAYSLDLAGEKQNEALCLKDTEIKTLEARIAEHVAVQERMEQTISSLNDRVAAAKMVNFEEKGENERLLSDIADSRKENQLLTMRVESLVRDQELAAQTQATLQRSFDDLREKYRVLQESFKEKAVEIRRYELTVSQLTVELKKLESSISESGFRCAAQESEIAQLKDEAKTGQLALREMTEDRDAAKERIRTLRDELERKNEEIVVLKADIEDREASLQKELRSWAQEVNQRQEMIQELTQQLGNANEKSAMYHSQLLEESEAAVKLRHEVLRFQGLAFQCERDAALAVATLEKREINLRFLETQLTEVSGIIALLYDKLSATASAAAQQESRLQALESSAETMTATATVAQDQVAKLQQEQKSLREALDEKEALRISSLQKEAAAQEENASLSHRVLELQTELCQATERYEKMCSLVSRQQQQVMKQSESALCCFLYSGPASVVVNEWWKRKVELVLSCALSTLSANAAYIVTLSSEKESLEKEAKELIAVVEEAKAAHSRKGVALAEKQEAQLARMQVLQAQLQATSTEKKQLSFQLSALLSRFESERRVAEESQKDATEKIKEEQLRREAAEKQCAKLRNGLDYEIKRKGEYKSALDELKRLREESEKNRLKEKSMAKAAVAKANDEVRYWVGCFSRLKTMVETACREGVHVPPIDADTLSRLEAARAQVLSSESVPLREQPANLATATGSPESLGKKRSRIEFC